MKKNHHIIVQFKSMNNLKRNHLSLIIPIIKYPNLKTAVVVVLVTIKGKETKKLSKSNKVKHNLTKTFLILGYMKSMKKILTIFQL